MPRPAADDDALGSAPLIHRCPFCHEGTHPDSSVVCRDCLTRHHGGCWTEGGGACSACQSPRRFEPEPLTLGKAISLLEGHGYDADAIRSVLSPAPAQAIPAQRRPFFLRWTQGLLTLSTAIGVVMVLAGIFFGGILDWYGESMRYAMTGSFLVAVLLGSFVTYLAVRD